MDPDMEGTLQQQLQEKVCDTHTYVHAYVEHTNIYTYV